MEISQPKAQSLNVEVISTLKSLQEVTGGDFLTKVYNIFLTQTASNLQALKDAVGAGDFSQIRAIAHGIKGSCLQIGAKTMADLAKEIEECQETDLSEKLPSLVEALISSHRESSTMLNKAFFG